MTFGPSVFRSCCSGGLVRFVRWFTRSGVRVSSVSCTLSLRAVRCPGARGTCLLYTPGPHQAHPLDYPTTVHPEAVTQINEALSLTLPDSHNALQLAMFTIYWNVPTDTGMVPQVAEPPLPPTVRALAKAAQAVAHREGALQD